MTVSVDELNELYDTDNKSSAVRRMYQVGALARVGVAALNTEANIRHSGIETLMEVMYRLAGEAVELAEQEEKERRQRTRC